MHSLAEQLIMACRREDIRIAVAESCTGGGLSFSLTTIPGSSSVFWGGAVTYDNSAKMKMLGVSNNTLENFGAVSDQCVSEMLTGIRDISGASLTAAVSGIAGPGGGSKDKPVGTVYLGVGYLSEKEIFREQFSGDREEIRRKSIKYLLEHMLEKIEKHVLLDGNV